MKTPYWNPYLETLAPEALRDIQIKKFRNMVAWGAKVFDHADVTEIAGPGAMNVLSSLEALT